MMKRLLNKLLKLFKKKEKETDLIAGMIPETGQLIYYRKGSSKG